MALPATPDHQEITRRIAAIVGADAVVLDTEELRFYALDLSEQPGLTPALVVRPQTAGQVSGIVKAAGELGYCVIPRGAGISYTRSHLPVQERSIIIDSRKMNRIIEINKIDRYVTLETGVTWFELREALEGSGYRVPYQGTYSGRISTIGGALAQNATGLGRGTLADHVLGLEVVLGDGGVIRTGSAVTAGTQPFYRYNGPDLTGIFLCDSGAFGFKTKVTLLLEPVPQMAFGCFAFKAYEDLVAAQAAIIRAGHSIESFAWGPNFLQSLAEQPVPPLKEQLALARKVLSRAPDKLRALRSLWRAWSPRGLGYLRNHHCAMYVISEAYSQADADRMMADITRIVRRGSGTVLPTTIGFGARHGPYPDVAGILFTPRNEIWFPVNGKFPISKAVEVTRAIERFRHDVAPVLERHGIRMECNFLTHGYFWGPEPIFFWKRESPYRERLRTGQAVRIDLPEPDDATRAVLELRRQLAALLRGMGALHLQWGKVYPYRESLGPDEWRFVERLKLAVDPEKIINPGSLGLGMD